MITKREKQAFDSFANRASAQLVRTAYLLCGDRGHAEDMAQTALLRTAHHWGTARGHPEAYARKVIVNLAKDRWRLLGRRPAETELTSSIDSPTRPETDAFLDRDELLSAVRRLPTGQRTVLVLRFFEDLTIEDTAAALGCSTGTVKSQTSRAIATLKTTLEHQEN